MSRTGPIVSFYPKRLITAWEKTRAEWLERLIENPSSIEAAQFIITCTTKIETYKMLGGAALYEDEEESDESRI